MPSVYEVLVNVKGAGRKEIVSPETYSKEEAEKEVAAIRKVQRQETDGWLELPWLSVKGSDVIAAFVQPVEEARPREPPRSIDELLRGMIEMIEDVGLRVVTRDGTPWNAPAAESSDTAAPEVTRTATDRRRTAPVMGGARRSHRY